MRPGAPADGAEVHFEGRVLDAAEQLARGSRLAGGLRRFGLGEGDVLAVLLRNSLQNVDVVHACRQAGVFFCPLNWHSTADEIRVLLVDSGARALVAHGDLLDGAVAALPAGIALLAVGGCATPGAVDYESWLAEQAPYDGPVVSPRGHLVYTSGTTGRPKGVVRLPIPLAELETRQAAIRQVVEATFGIRAGCRALVPAPLYHSAPSTFLQSALTLAERLVLMPRFDAEALLAAIEAHRIDVVYLVPIMYVRLLRLPEAVRRRHDLSSLRFVASTGAPCDPTSSAR